MHNQPSKAQITNSNPSQELVNKLVNLYQSGQTSKAERLCRKLLKSYPKSLLVINVLGAALTSQGKFKNALQTYNKVIQLKPDYAEAYFNRGVVFQELGKLQKAVDSYNQAIKLKLDYAQAFNNLGLALQALGEHNKAVNSYNKAIKFKSDYTAAYFNRGVVFHELGKFQKAVDSYNQAIKLKPDYVQAFNNLGLAFQELGKLNKAINSYDQAIAIKPDYFEAYYNQGITLEVLGKIDESIKNYTKAIQIKHDYAEPHWNLALLLLLTGDLQNGWTEYEYGRFTEKKDRRLVKAPYKLWKDEPLTNKEILITAEQGIGDEIMFSSCIPEIINKEPKRIVVECDSRIASLLERSFKPIETLNRKDRDKESWINDAGNIDFQISLGSLPKFFRQKMNDFPLKKSFLLVNNALNKKWKDRYDLLGDGLKIGISWRGGNNDKLRSINLQLWEDILQSKAYFINLQYGNHSDEVEQLKTEKGIHIHNWDDVDPLVKLDDFSAQISALDLVISIDNSTVHFAGALGTPAWVLLPLSSNYRWMQDRDDSPWYPTMKLFRQKHHGDWSNVFLNIKRELNKIGVVL